MSQESRPDVTGILPGCHRISARIRREGWPDGAGILNEWIDSLLSNVRGGTHRAKTKKADPRMKECSHVV